MGGKVFRSWRQSLTVLIEIMGFPPQVSLNLSQKFAFILVYSIFSYNGVSIFLCYGIDVSNELLL